MDAWRGFNKGNWCQEIDVRDFIIRNYTPYEGDESFLVGPTDRTRKLWEKVSELLKKERENGGYWMLIPIQFQRLRLINLDI